MEKGYIENGFIIDLTHAAKVSEVIYELSKILDMPESKGKFICLKLGTLDLTVAEFTSIQALINVMESKLEFISTSSTKTLESATELGIKISEFTTSVQAPTFANDEPVEVTNALNNIFGEEITQEDIKAPFEEISKEENAVTATEEAPAETVSQTEEVEKDTEHAPTEAAPEIVSEEKTENVILKTEFIPDIKNEIEPEVPAIEEVADDEISPVVRSNEAIESQFERQMLEDEQDENIVTLRGEPETLPTSYIRKTIRSGQSISSEGNIVIIGDVNPGAEVIAKGDITIWGILGGIAHAGSGGNNYAIIRALKLNPVQIRIGSVFARRPDTINIPYVQKSSEYVPEEAFTYKGNIVIRKIHEEN